MRVKHRLVLAEEEEIAKLVGQHPNFVHDGREHPLEVLAAYPEDGWVTVEVDMPDELMSVFPGEPV